MVWMDLLKSQIESAYASADGLIGMVSDDELGWKPETGENWMTVGQLLRHLTDACGAPCKGFVTGDWGMPEGADMSELPPEEMLPPAEKFPTIDTVADAKRLLAEDKAVALKMIEQSGEEDLGNRKVTAPWNPREMVLGRQLFQMIGHLEQHKAQLFYYLKLQGKPVDTRHLWGM
ncbi:MAG: DinB family protein [Candidatus Bipolaricaulia bacterium]